MQLTHELLKPKRTRWVRHKFIESVEAKFQGRMRLGFVLLRASYAALIHCIGTHPSEAMSVTMRPDAEATASA